MQESFHKTSWSFLAAWRFVLASMVVLGHFFLMVRPDRLALFRADLLNPTSAVFGFFLLSGYSIAASLEREQQGFYRRRVLRIWPLYVAAIAFGLVVQSVLRLSPAHSFLWPLGERTPGASGWSVLASLLMLQSVVCAPVSFDGPLWSLSPEWWHYMVAPRLKKLPTAALALLILASFAAFLWMQPKNAGIDTLANWRLLLVTSWMWVTGFLYFRLRRTPLGFAVLAFPATLSLALGKNWGLPLLLTIFVLTLSTEVRISGWTAKFGNVLGDVSYPLYLFHLPAIMLLLGLGVKNAFVLLAVPLLLAAAAQYGIDQPLRSRFAAPKKQRMDGAATNDPSPELPLNAVTQPETGD
ncbi:MAG: acyltransferase [Acidobacteriota bacterium]|nr:acyltransferase [Acidobacteriota bacterium]